MHDPTFVRYHALKYHALLEPQQHAIPVTPDSVQWSSCLSQLPCISQLPYYFPAAWVNVGYSESAAWVNVGHSKSAA